MLICNIEKLSICSFSVILLRYYREKKDLSIMTIKDKASRVIYFSGKKKLEGRPVRETKFFLAVVLGTSRASKVYYLGRGWFPNLLRLLM
jgi:hypothetical protein